MRPYVDSSNSLVTTFILSVTRFCHFGQFFKLFGYFLPVVLKFSFFISVFDLLPLDGSHILRRLSGIKLSGFTAWKMYLYINSIHWYIEYWYIENWYICTIQLYTCIERRSNTLNNMEKATLIIFKEKIDKI